ncbi:NAD-dependent epimerase/dehydratase family protein [Kangiella sp. TOML190]|uniref:NAD-dependent epimerase/dehydratase family protein n=1 Tax=Kangiella sp. TOML190 TaxID=2931351 RepID=UPI002041C5E9|nr:NAD-dependent epimerase/dehydratase family protein [Kangiella sp. TOML190]
MKAKVLVTGSSGFIGSALSNEFLTRGYEVIGASRTNTIESSKFSFYKIPGLSEYIDWKPLFEEVDVIIHTAARAHILNDRATDPLSEFNKVNVDATIELAKQAISAKVKRFVFISSVGVSGSRTKGRPLDENIAYEPVEAYAISKLLAEKKLTDVVRGTNTELVIIRPTLVYSHEAPGNFKNLLKLVSTKLPLPFGSTQNKRSFVFLDNLVDFIILAAKHPKAAGNSYLISDGHDISTNALISNLRLGMGVRKGLFPFAAILMKGVLSVLGRRKMYSQLFEDLQVDISKARVELAWTPILGVEDALKLTGKRYIADKKR